MPWLTGPCPCCCSRSPGREAYPGDVFYLHSRLLERACRLTKEYGGGSMTALPIIETLAGDVSAYIPTNVISITDGQIYPGNGPVLRRPAARHQRGPVRVPRGRRGPDQGAMKKSAGTLRIDLARFRELEVFTQFSSDLDKETRQALDHGKRLMEILKQPLYNPMPVWKQAVILLRSHQRPAVQCGPGKGATSSSRALLTSLQANQPRLM